MTDTINLTEYIIAKIYNREDIHVQTEINENIINALENIEIIEVVGELPSSNIKDKLYLVPNSTSEENNLYDIYIYVDSSWERVDILDFKDTDASMETIAQALELKADKIVATQEDDGLMSSADKTKLDSMDTIEMIVTYSDETTETFNLFYQNVDEE